MYRNRGLRRACDRAGAQPTDGPYIGLPSLETVIPRQFGTWTLVPEISPVRPADPDAYVQPDPLAGKIYSQEVGRGYTDGHGNIVMLMVAYGPVQNYRLKSHRPEICYTANGFRISEKRTPRSAIATARNPSR
ncbi:exosortase C-terminal domain/associated protein EpsI [Bradyrhizobium sp. RDT10]